MTDEELAAIRDRWNGISQQEHISLLMLPSTQVRRDVGTLLAEVERLRERERDRYIAMAEEWSQQPGALFSKTLTVREGESIEYSWHSESASYRDTAIQTLREENAAMREIVQAVAAIRETGTWDSSQPYDAQISALTIHKARALLGKDTPR